MFIGCITADTPANRSYYQSLGLSGIPFRVPPEDSDLCSCQVCDCQMWASPKQQSAMRKLADDNQDFLTICALCVSLIKAYGGEVIIRALGRKPTVFIEEGGKA